MCARIHGQGPEEGTDAKEERKIVRKGRVHARGEENMYEKGKWGSRGTPGIRRATCMYDYIVQLTIHELIKTK